MVKLSVLSVAEAFVGAALEFDVAGGAITALALGDGADAWASCDACGVCGAGRTIASVAAWAEAAVSARLHALRDRPRAAIIAASRIPFVSMD